MPFKTKARKIAASKKKHSLVTLGKVSYENKSSKFKQIESIAPKSKIKNTKKSSELIIEDLSYIRFDVLRILIISLIIIAAQVALSLTLR